ncbi:flagellar biosynthesis anti-sigma factor FlgM [Paraliobacillus sp. JSM ZJ581]
MKIQGANHSNFNPYQKQFNKQAETVSKQPHSDKLQISEQAKKMQESEQVQSQREIRVNEIKQAIENGKYQIEPKETARKMLNFWGKG